MAEFLSHHCHSGRKKPQKGETQEASAYGFVYSYEYQNEPQEPKSPNNQFAEKVGFPPIPERAPKSVQNRTFCTPFAQKVRSCILSGALSGIGGNPTFSADKNYLAISALWLVLIFTSIQFQAGSPTNKATASKLFSRECLCPSTALRGFDYC